jgi:hypothetical protein
MGAEVERLPASKEHGEPWKKWGLYFRGARDSLDGVVAKIPAHHGINSFDVHGFLLTLSRSIVPSATLIDSDEHSAKLIMGVRFS